MKLPNVAGFQDEMRAKGIHVGMPVGAEHVVRCVTCGDIWPCVGSQTANYAAARVSSVQATENLSTNQEGTTQ